MVVYNEELLFIRDQINKTIFCKNKNNENWVCDNCFNKYISKKGFDKNNEKWYLISIKYNRGDLQFDQIDKQELSNINDDDFRKMLISAYKLLYLNIHNQRYLKE